jgi:type IV secretory pathway TraG/TraD family ATPase VirD4
MNRVGFMISDREIVDKKTSIIPPIDFQHTIIEGSTGNGKTATLIMPILSDRIKRNHCIVFFDHKGHEHKKVKYLAKQFGRLHDVVEIAKPHAAYINLFSELDVIRLKELIKENGMNKDPYWSNSAANVMEDITLVYRTLHDIASQLESYEVMMKRAKELFGELHKFGIDIFKTPSFKDISLIVSSAKSFKTFFKIINSIPYKIERLLQDDYFEHDEIENKMILLAKVFKLKKHIESAKRFSLSDEKSDVNSGNNAVLQTLDNAIASYAKKDYMNDDEYTMKILMETNAIIIVDSQSLGEDMMKVFFESILKKAVMRLRNGSSTPFSIFIDESNRVLPSSIDLHNDVLREASVELILAIQNNEQMISKFGETEWKAIKSNIKHQYSIVKNHQVFYNDEGIYSDPLLIKQELLDDIERDYFMIEHNRRRIEEGFIGTSDCLPKRFSVVYDLDSFDRTSEIIIMDENANTYIYSYFGKSILSQVKDSFPEIETITYSERNDIEVFSDFESENDANTRDIGNELVIEYT